MFSSLCLTKRVQPTTPIDELEALKGATTKDLTSKQSIQKLPFLFLPFIFLAAFVLHEQTKAKNDLDSSDEAG